MRPSYFSKSRRRLSLGMSLIELMIVSMVILAAIAGLYRYYASVSAAEDAHRDSQNAVAMTNAIIKSYGPMANFTGLNTSSLIKDGLVPSNMYSDGTNTIQNAFGGTVDVRGVGAGTAAARRSFQMTYTGIPSNQCGSFVSQVSRLVPFTSITVGSTQLVANDGTPMDQAALSAACKAAPSSTVVLTYTRASQGSAETLNQCVVPPTDHQTLNCAPGYTGAITQERTWACSSFYALPSTAGWVTTSDTCKIICVADPSSPQTQAGPIASAGLPGCAAGELGSIIYTRSSVCGGPTGYPTWGNWTVKSNNCAAACIVPSPKQQALPCAPGMSGSDVQHMYATCPAVVPPYTGSVGTPTWGPWVDDGNTCACAVPSPSTDTRWDPTLRSKPCGAGMTGNQTYQMQQQRSASCPNTHAGFVWSAWSDTGVIQNLNTTACAPICKPDATTQWVSKTGTCASGYSGTVTWESLQTRTSVCNGSSSTPTNGPWTDSGQKRNQVDTCQPNGCSIPSGTTRSWSVGGQTCSGTIAAGNLTSGGFASATDSTTDGGLTGGSAQFQCALGVLSATAAPGATCSATTCVVPAGTAFSWTVGAATCNYTTPSAKTYAAGTNAAFSDTGAPTTGSASFACAMGTTSIKTTPNAGATCTGSCPAQPANQTRRLTCPAGQYGYIDQTLVYGNQGYPTCWVAGSWQNTGGPGCHPCPTTKTTTSDSWGSTVAAACPANMVQAGGTNPNAATQQLGYTTTTTTTYACPAGTLSAPTGVVTTKTVANGQTRNYNSSNCSYTCAADLAVWQASKPGPAVGYDGEASPAAYSEFRTVVIYDPGCPAGYAGIRRTTQKQVRSLYCPNGGYGMGPLFRPGVASGYPNPSSNPAYYYAEGWTNSGAPISVNTCSCNGLLSVGEAKIGPDGVPTTPMAPPKCIPR